MSQNNENNKNKFSKNLFNRKLNINDIISKPNVPAPKLNNLELNRTKSFNSRVFLFGKNFEI